MPEFMLDEEEIIEVLTPYVVRCLNGDKDDGRVTPDHVRGRIITYDDEEEEGRTAVVFRVIEGECKADAPDDSGAYT